MATGAKIIGIVVVCRGKLLMFFGCSVDTRKKASQLTSIQEIRDHHELLGKRRKCEYSRVEWPE
jgi:hypothetical protein